MSTRRFSDFESAVDDFLELSENTTDNTPSTKLERRRRIEEIQEAKVLREELEDYSF